MAQVLIRDLDPKVVERYKERARRKGHSLQAELKAVLEREARVTMTEAAELAAEMRARLGPRPHLDSASLIREDRDR